MKRKYLESVLRTLTDLKKPRETAKRMEREKRRKDHVVVVAAIARRIWFIDPRSQLLKSPRKSLTQITMLTTCTTRRTRRLVPLGPRLMPLPTRYSIHCTPRKRK